MPSIGAHGHAVLLHFRSGSASGGGEKWWRLTCHTQSSKHKGNRSTWVSPYLKEHRTKERRAGFQLTGTAPQRSGEALQVWGTIAELPCTTSKQSTWTARLRDNCNRLISQVTQKQDCSSETVAPKVHTFTALPLRQPAVSAFAALLVPNDHDDPELTAQIQ